jgi:hypothetical protein
MARTGPFYSSKLHRYHDQTLCTEGGAIEPENLRQGQGGRPICDQCKRIALDDRLGRASDDRSQYASSMRQLRRP